MNVYYWMHKEYGYLIPETDLYMDAIEMGYENITNPTSTEYVNYNLYYEPTNVQIN